MSIKHVLTFASASLIATQGHAQAVEPEAPRPTVVATTSARTTILEGVRLSWSFHGTPRLVVAQSGMRADITSNTVILPTAHDDEGRPTARQRVHYVDFS